MLIIENLLLTGEISFTFYGGRELREWAKDK